jgi:hypothetical protein
MRETASACSSKNDSPAPVRRLLRRPTLDETEQIARGCPPEGFSVPVLVAAIRHETGCSRATAYRAVADALAEGVLKRHEPSQTHLPESRDNKHGP